MPDIARTDGARAAFAVPPSARGPRFGRGLRRTALAAMLLGLVACEGAITGQQVSDQPLTQNEDGSYAPVRLQLDPGMNPVAVNFKGSTIAHPNESGRWNSYVANLTRNGAAVASASFNINNPGTRDHDHGGPFVQTLFFVTVPEAGEYELTLGVTRPKEITIQEPHLEVRRNTQPAPR